MQLRSTHHSAQRHRPHLANSMLYDATKRIIFNYDESLNHSKTNQSSVSSWFSLPYVQNLHLHLAKNCLINLNLLRGWRILGDVLRCLAVSQTRWQHQPQGPQTKTLVGNPSQPESIYYTFNLQLYYIDSRCMFIHCFCRGPVQLQ